jgi:hypothetical protein
MTVDIKKLFVDNYAEKQRLYEFTSKQFLNSSSKLIALASSRDTCEVAHVLLEDFEAGRIKLPKLNLIDLVAFVKKADKDLQATKNRSIKGITMSEWMDNVRRAAQLKNIASKLLEAYITSKEL